MKAPTAKKGSLRPILGRRKQTAFNKQKRAMAHAARQENAANAQSPTMNMSMNTTFTNNTNTTGFTMVGGAQQQQEAQQQAQSFFTAFARRKMKHGLDIDAAEDASGSNSNLKMKKRRGTQFSANTAAASTFGSPDLLNGSHTESFDGMGAFGADYGDSGDFSTHLKNRMKHRRLRFGVAADEFSASTEESFDCDAEMGENSTFARSSYRKARKLASANEDSITSSSHGSDDGDDDSNDHTSSRRSKSHHAKKKYKKIRRNEHDGWGNEESSPVAGAGGALAGIIGMFSAVASAVSAASAVVQLAQLSWQLEEALGADIIEQQGLTPEAAEDR